MNSNMNLTCLFFICSRTLFLLMKIWNVLARLSLRAMSRTIPVSVIPHCSRRSQNGYSLEKASINSSFVWGFLLAAASASRQRQAQPNLANWSSCSGVIGGLSL